MGARRESPRLFFAVEDERRTEQACAHDVRAPPMHGDQPESTAVPQVHDRGTRERADAGNCDSEDRCHARCLVMVMFG